VPLKYDWQFPAHCRATVAAELGPDLDGARPDAEHLVDRARLYETACRAIASAVSNTNNGRPRRRAERKAILLTMQQFGLIQRIQGGAPFRGVVRERVS
jgi:hypothetical protein